MSWWPRRRKTLVCRFCGSAVFESEGGWATYQGYRYCLRAGRGHLPKDPS